MQPLSTKSSTEYKSSLLLSPLETPSSSVSIPNKLIKDLREVESVRVPILEGITIVYIELSGLDSTLRLSRTKESLNKGGYGGVAKRRLERRLVAV